MSVQRREALPGIHVSVMACDGDGCEAFVSHEGLHDQQWQIVTHYFMGEDGHDKAEEHLCAACKPRPLPEAVRAAQTHP